MSETDDLIGRDLKLNSDLSDLDLKGTDISTVARTENLAQAILLRMKTAMRSLPVRPDYGSRLSQLLGKGQSRENEYVARLMVGEALMQEKRIAAVNEIKVEYLRNELTIDLSVLGINATDLTSIEYVTRV